MIYANVPQIIFKNKQNIPWNEVEQYLKKYIGKSFVVKEYGDVIHIAGEFPDDFTESQYTKKLRGGLAKAKANSGQVIGEMIENAQKFTIPIDDAGTVRRNAYKATAVVRIKEDKLYLYDIINIKKEASTPL